MFKFIVIFESGSVMEIIIRKEDINGLIGLLENAKGVKQYYIPDILAVDQEKVLFGPNCTTTKKWRGPKYYELYRRFEKEHQEEFLSAVLE